MAKRHLHILWRKASLIFWIILVGSVSLVFPQDRSHQLSQADFEKELLLAIEADDNDMLESLIKEHRFIVKPLVLLLIKENVSLDLKSEKSQAQEELRKADLIATEFYDIFNEKSLLNIVNALKNLSFPEKQEKFLADSLCNEGKALRTDSETRQKAAECFLESIEIYRRINDEYGQAIALGGLGIIYYNSNTKLSLKYYNEALKARTEVDDKYLIASTLRSIGVINLNKFNDSPEAIKYFKQASIIQREIEDWQNLGRTFTYIGQAYERSDNLPLAIESYRKSFDASKEIGNQSSMAQAMLICGANLHKINNYPEALKTLQISLEIYSNICDTLGIGDVLTQQGFVFTNLGDYTSAIEKFTEALKMYKGRDDWGTAGVYNNMGITYQSAKRFDKATEYYFNALEYYEALKDTYSIISTLNNIGTVFYDMGDFSKAEEFHLKGLEQSRKEDIALYQMHCIINLANDQNQLGKFDKAFSNYHTALELVASLTSKEGEWKAMVGIAENYKLRGNFDKAIEYNEKGLAIIEEIRSGMGRDEFKTNYLARERYVFEDVINMLGDLHNQSPGNAFDHKAFEIAENCKSRALLDLLSESGPENSSHQESSPVSLEEFKSSCLDKNTYLVEYSLGDSCSWVWLISKDDEQLIKLPDQNVLAEQVELLRFALQNPDRGNIDNFIESSYRLYSLILEPVVSKLRKGSKLVIVPDGVLNYLPFEALVTNKKHRNSVASYKDLSYMVLKHPISYAQSASVLHNLLITLGQKEKSRDTKLDLVAFGDPFYALDNSSVSPEGYRLERLINSGKEVEGISRFFSENKSVILLREKASEEALKNDDLLSDCRYLHFATHGVIDEKNPAESSIVLSQDNDPTEDGFLKAREIFNLKTDAELVVLSACQTGLGKLVRGEGMVGLSRAFMYAGTPSIVVSLWSVSDASTATLMEELYRNLIEKGLSKGDALRQAQLSLIDSGHYAHPFYWAPFTLIGDWK